MKLESIFVKHFFFLFLFILIVLILFVSFTMNHFLKYHGDFITSKDMLAIETNYANTHLNNANLLVYNDLTKIIYGLFQLITYYKFAENKINNDPSFNYSVLNYTMSFNKSLTFNDSSISDEEINFFSCWFVDEYTSEKNLTNNNNANLFKQLSIISNMSPILYTLKKSFGHIINSIFFFFEDTNLIINYPYINGKNSGYVKDVLNSKSNPSWCTDSNGEIYKTYRISCSTFYKNMKKATENLYDINFKDQQNRTIFISELYHKEGDNSSDEYIYTMCIKFNENINYNISYICANASSTNLFKILTNINLKIRGFFLITSVGYNGMFYYPRNAKEESENIAEFLFKWDTNYYLDEKINFISYLQKNLTSNYKNLIDFEKYEKDPTNIFNSITINSEQFLYINNTKYYYTLFPIIMKNLNNDYEHLLSIIYFYNLNDYINNMFSFQSKTYYAIFLENILFAFFGFTDIYLILLTLKLLAKYIVVPIININYMIKGINIGGRKRLKYLNSLQKKEEKIKTKIKELNAVNSTYYNAYNDDDDNITKNIDPETNYNITMQNNSIDIVDLKTQNKSKTLSLKTPLKENIKTENYFNDLLKNEMANKKVEDLENLKKKYNEETSTYENEVNFYDFNEELLQYRPIEINELTDTLLNLKEAYLLAGKRNDNLENIISYSKAEDIFENYKKLGAKSVCQSNMGNLFSQLFKYDKAIYHLVTSLLDKNMKKFLSRIIKDEFDESDNLYYLIFNNYNSKSLYKFKTNQLVIQQQNNFKTTVPRFIIERLINERYNKLIYVYSKFFSLMRKANNHNKIIVDIYSHKTYHTINYYHKILIQYIYLCFESNDLIKIGESILDYIEFLIKFKLKSNKDTQRIMLVINIREKEKQNIKKMYFDKILRWFNLFDSYVDHVYSKTNLWNEKSVLNEYINSTNLNKNSNDCANNSVMLFKVNEQRGDFLKGKFSYLCENYGDAIFYFIRAAKKKYIVYDGLIKKRSLKKLLKISKLINKILNQDKRFKEFTSEDLPSLKKYNQVLSKIHYDNSNNSIKNILSDTNSTNSRIDNIPNITFVDGITNVIKEITKDISDCENNQFKDIIMIFDNNNCNDSLITKKFFENIKDLLTCKLNNNDRISLFYFDEKYHIICPLTFKYLIDYTTLIKNLEIFLKKKEMDKEIYYDIDQSPLKDGNYLEDSIKKKINDFSLEKNISGSESNDNSEEEEFEDEGGEFSDDQSDNQIDNSTKIKYSELLKNSIKSLNFCINYFKLKDIGNEDKYIVYLTNIFNYKVNVNNIIKNELRKLNDKKDINLIIMGKLFEGVEIYFDDRLGKKIKERRNIINSVLVKFDFKSQIVNLDLDKLERIKNILSTNSVISDNMTFRNEIY